MIPNNPPDSHLLIEIKNQRPTHNTYFAIKIHLFVFHIQVFDGKILFVMHFFYYEKLFRDFKNRFCG
ncbi:hypothetical protein CLV31_1022 [Algoriphagus aquaeductus]|uniref:Uncharacterized protein n=1 Tax=Algoriphagus aquaeductus TaxID=475299 RepID=A0A326S7W6_9BACT|nr:hypothetical protein CLV31_1022 [Algoriphagus aquaeductus]